MIIINDQGYGQVGAKQGRNLLDKLGDGIGPNWHHHRDIIKRVCGWILDELPRIMYGMGREGDTVIRGVVETPDSIEIRIALPGDHQRVVGSVTAAGINIIIRRQPSGGYAIEIETFIERLKCLNGMTRPETHRYVVNDAGKIEEVLGKIGQAMPLIQGSVCRNHARYLMSAERPVDALRAMEAIADGHLRIEDAATRTGLRFLGPRIYCAFVVEPGNTVFHVVNAISRAANDIAGIRPPPRPRRRSTVVEDQQADVPMPRDQSEDAPVDIQKWLRGAETQAGSVYAGIQRIAGHALDFLLDAFPAGGGPMPGMPFPPPDASPEQFRDWQGMMDEWYSMWRHIMARRVKRE